MVVISRKKLEEIKRSVMHVKELAQEEKKKTIHLTPKEFVMLFFHKFLYLMFPPFGWTGMHHFLDGDFSLCFVYSLSFGIGALAYLCDFFFIHFSREGSVWKAARYLIYPTLFMFYINVVYMQYENPIIPVENAMLIGMFLMNQISWIGSIFLIFVVRTFPILRSFPLAFQVFVIFFFDWKIKGGFIFQFFPFLYFNDMWFAKHICRIAMVLSILYYSSQMVGVDLSGMFTRIRLVLPQHRHNITNNN